MSYNYSEITFPSSDGKNKVFAEIYTPRTESARAVIQLSHGMIDYVSRYTELAEYLTANGYIFAGNHHLGHGKTAACDADFGYFAENGGVDYLLRDLHSMNRQLRAMFPALPVIMLGHSMGSFLARLYAVRYPHSIAGVIIHGTSGPNPLIPFGKLAVALRRMTKTDRYRSSFITKMAFGSYNSHYPKSEGKLAWLTRDVEAVKGKYNDKYASFKFTLSAYRDLFDMISRSNSSEWFSNYPKELPTLIVSGDDDPVGNYGKGPTYVYKKLLMARHSKLSLKLYEGARHELFNEKNREEVFRDLKLWLDGVTK